MMTMTDLPPIPNPINITDEAAKHIHVVMQEENLMNHYLRITVVGGGCSGLQYSMDFTDEISENMDIDFELSGIKFVVDCFSAPHLMGTQIDYIDNLTGTGFKFHNPNITRKCGCGMSFAT